MLDQLAKMDMSIYFQTVIFLLFIALLLRLQWKMGSLGHVLANVLRYAVLLFIFIYLFLNWASDVNPTLRNSSILIMTLINLYLRECAASGKRLRLDWRPPRAAGAA